MFGFLVRLLGRMPRRVLLGIGAVIAFLAGSLLRIRRSHVESAMAGAGIRSPSSTARSMYRSLGASLAELLWLSASNHRVADLVIFDNDAREKIQELLQSERGFVIAASHTGNWDVAACAMAQIRSLMVVTKRLRVKGLDREWQRIRSGRGVTLQGAEGAMAAGKQALERGAMVAMMIDQVPMSASHAVTTEYLGASAFVDKSAAALAARASVPLMVATAHRNADGRQVLSVLAVLVPPKTGRSEWIEAATVDATHALDAFVRAHPSEWLWMHRRWKAPPSLHRAAPLEG